MEKEMLIVNNLQAGYGGKAIVRIDRLEVKAEGKCLIRGPSGSGKTTLLYAIAGLGKLYGGDVLINGTSIYSLSENRRDAMRGINIGIVFQNLNLVKSLTVIENVLLGAFVNGKEQIIRRADELLIKLGLSGLGGRKATEISQGQAQRVAIARALLHKPKLILADEPTSSLDDEAASKVASLLTSLSAENGAALVVSTHDARVANLFDQTLVLRYAA